MKDSKLLSLELSLDGSNTDLVIVVKILEKVVFTKTVDLIMFLDNPKEKLVLDITKMAEVAFKNRTTS